MPVQIGSLRLEPVLVRKVQPKRPEHERIGGRHACGAHEPGGFRPKRRHVPPTKPCGKVLPVRFPPRKARAQRCPCGAFSHAFDGHALALVVVHEVEHRVVPVHERIGLEAEQVLLPQLRPTGKSRRTRAFLDRTLVDHPRTAEPLGCEVARLNEGEHSPARHSQPLGCLLRGEHARSFPVGPPACADIVPHSECFRIAAHKKAFRMRNAFSNPCTAGCFAQNARPTACRSPIPVRRTPPRGRARSRAGRSRAGRPGLRPRLSSARAAPARGLRPARCRPWRCRPAW